MNKVPQSSVAVDLPRRADRPIANSFDRRSFIQTLTGVGAGTLAAGVAGGGLAQMFVASPAVAAGKTPAGFNIESSPGDDILIRMQADVRRAMEKSVEQRRWAMVIDLRKCVGCHACTIACVVENKLPPGVVYRPVTEEQVGTYPNVTRRFMPRLCNQCDNPPCVPVCPVDATWKRPDGIVAIDYDQCIGCGYCITACPYNARTRDLGENYTDNTPELQPYEQQPNFEYGKAWNRKDHKSPVGNARKCHFCVHRLEEGELPQCVSTCIGRATYFGDANNPNSLVNELAKKPNAIRLLEEKGTKPRVIYLI